MMKHIGWKAKSLFLGLVLGMGGLMFHSFVSGEEPRSRELSTEDSSESVSGRVKSFLKNDKGDTDGMVMGSGAMIHFPPHMASEITKLINIGDRIEIRGHEQTLPKGEVVFEAEQIKKDGKTIQIDEARPPQAPRMRHALNRTWEKPMNATGTIKEFVRNRHGDVDGLLLSDGVEVKFPPHQGGELQDLAKVGADVRVEGRRHETPRGDIHLHADRIVATDTGRAVDRDEPHKGRRIPPHEEILAELRQLRRLIESQQKN